MDSPKEMYLSDEGELIKGTYKLNYIHIQDSEQNANKRKVCTFDLCGILNGLRRGA